MREPPPTNPCGHYDRPNQAWVCGLADGGHACPTGPTARGRCPALAECSPVRDGDRWQCNRSTLRGGQCETGPTPDGKCGCIHRCRPVRNARAVRARFVVGFTILAVGGLLVVLSAEWRDRVLSPGPLAASHAQLLAGTQATKETCASCHPAAERSVAGWAASVVVGHGARPTQTQLCIKCHETTIAPDLALSPHNVPLDQLRQISAAVASAPPGGATRFANAAFAPGEHVACAKCHREHRGLGFSLTAIDDDACQACHRQRFDHFATDHPDFGTWPYPRRTRIVFNHASHQTKHFAEKKQSFDCRACHLDDATGRGQLTAEYAAACAACHDEKIATSVAPGVSMLALPMLDVETLRDAGHDIGNWPELATGDFDGRLPAPMKLLLAADPAAAQAMKLLGADFEFMDIDPDDPQHLAACATLAKAIQQLLADLAGAGSAVVQERLTAALGRQVDVAGVHALTAGLSTDTLRGAAAWLPGTVSNNADAGPSGPPTLSSAEPENRDGRPLKPRRDLSFDPAGTWFRDDETFSIRYRPVAHADPVLAAWLDLIVRVPESASQPLVATALNELAQTASAGQCISCHSIEQAAAGRLAVNWRAYQPSEALRSFTKFSHGPHLVLPQLADCTACHAIDAQAVGTTAYAGHDPGQFTSEFRPITRQQCAACHTPHAAGESCQQCHNYHVEVARNWHSDEAAHDTNQQAAVVLRSSSFGLRIDADQQNPRAADARFRTSTETRPERR